MKTEKVGNMVKVVVLLPRPMYEKLHSTKSETGEPVNQIIRACIRAGYPHVVSQIEAGMIVRRD